MKRELKKVDWSELEFPSSEELGYAVEEASYFIISHLLPGQRWELLEQVPSGAYVVRVSGQGPKGDGVYEMTQEQLMEIPLGIMKTPQVHVKLDEAKVTEQLRKRGMI